ncbi:MAG: AAA family ATPase [Thiovulaceae bacterium]|nr:AAA family ATPase [Sulfurimonadaceae bacterium]
MELVYLWIEKYKNIENQEFNFSSRFECKYIVDTNKLTIDKKNNIVNIFPNNINITAIVGENGSGKSSILELLFTRYNEEKVFFIFYDKDNNQFLSLGTKSDFNVNIVDDRLKEIQFNAIECLPNTKAIYYSNILNKNDLYLQEFLVPHTYTHTVNISTSHMLSQMKLIETNLQGGWNKSNTGFDKIYRSFEIQQIQNAIILLQDKVVQIPFELPKKLIIRNINFKSFIENAKNKFENTNYRRILDVIEKNNDSNTIFKNYLSTNLIISLLLENINSNNPILDELLNIVLNQKMSNYLEDFYANVKNSLYQHQFTFNGELVDASYIDLFFDLADEILGTLDKQSNLSTDSYLLELNIQDTNFGFLKAYEKLIQQSEYFWDISWRGLSSGEESFLYQFSRLYNLKNNYKDDPYKNLIVGNGIAENLIILIDEGEITLHPEWQKKYISYLVDFLEKNFSQNIHLILTTHSPFILSDIPKQNLVFLKNGEQVEIDIETFGANIHTLLAHGFFMNNSLIGEFAKNKIQNVIDILNEENPSIEYKDFVKNIIDSIGEPFLKNKLQEMYDRVFLDDIERNKKIRTLQREIEKLKNVDNSQE